MIDNFIYKNFTFVETLVQAFIAILDLRILHNQSEILKSKASSGSILSHKSTALCTDGLNLMEIYLTEL